MMARNLRRMHGHTEIQPTADRAPRAQPRRVNAHAFCAVGDFREYEDARAG